MSVTRPEPPSESQSVTEGLTQAAIFLVATIAEGAEHELAVRELCADVSGLVRSVGFRDTGRGVSCVLGVGSDAWDRLFGEPKPRELHPFRAINGVHHAVSTPGDLLFHIRAERMDLCFELAAQITTRLGAAITIVDETHGFNYFDKRDLLGFVDGTENPTGASLNDSAFIGDEDPLFEGGSYVIVQKYLHDLPKWNATPVETQEGVIGRTKLSDMELDDAVKPSFAHNALTVIEDEDGNELPIVRANMPFGDIGKGEFGTYFIGYACTPERTERMLDNMFIGNPPGNYDRLLDFSRAVTGTLFFIPTSTFLDDVDPMASPAQAAPEPPSSAEGLAIDIADPSLGIGSLKNED